VLLCSVYLRTHPEVALERTQLRARKEESRVTLHYLKKLHDLHEDWLINQTKFSCPAPVSSYFVTVSICLLIPFPDVLHYQQCNLFEPIHISSKYLEQEENICVCITDIFAGSHSFSIVKDSELSFRHVLSVYAHVYVCVCVCVCVVFF